MTHWWLALSLLMFFSVIILAINGDGLWVAAVVMTYITSDRWVTELDAEIAQRVRRDLRRL